VWIVWQCFEEEEVIAMLEARHISLRRGSTILLEDASFQVYPGEKVGLVGINGAGKTTLLKTLYGELEPEEGTVRRPERVGYLGQERLTDALLMTGMPDANGTVTVRDFLLAGRDLGALASEMRRTVQLLDRATAPDSKIAITIEQLEALAAHYSELEDRFGQANGYEAESECMQLLNGLGMRDVELDRPITALSGGQKTKLALARVLFSAPELLLLDEPTNHLDGKATRWLMDYLTRYEGAVILVSHDLVLLDHAIARVLHLDHTTRTLVMYTGNYSSYLRQRQMAETRAQTEMERTQTKITQLEEQANWMRGKTKKIARRAKVLDRTVEKMRKTLPDASRLPRRERVFTMDLPIARQSGREVLRVEALGKSYGSKVVLSDLDFDIDRGQRLVVIGRNGAGKTTLLRVLAGVMPPSFGTVQYGYNVDLGYYAQEHELLHPELTLLEELRQAADVLPHRTGQLPSEGQLRTLLGRFLFSGEHAFQKVGTLSGGEKTRLALARLMLGGYNTLLLDEPTNNLDVASRAHVVKALAGYRGTLAIVSHDVAFVEALSPDYALLLPEGRVTYYDDELLALVVKT
jgi:ATP-binding cassette subfamily F protein 3